MTIALQLLYLGLLILIAWLLVKRYREQRNAGYLVLLVALPAWELLLIPLGWSLDRWADDISGTAFRQILGLQDVLSALLVLVGLALISKRQADESQRAA